MTPRILIVDDEPNVRLNYRTTLETENYDVAEANGAGQAFALLSKLKFELAILDLRMPEMDGLKLLEKMRDRGFIPPVIIITAYGDVPHAVKAMKLGAIDFLQKPLTPAELREVVSEILARHLPPAQRVSWEEMSFEVLMQNGKRLINLGKFKDAREYIGRALQMRADSADAFNLAGVLFELLEDYARARRCYECALRLSHTHDAAQQNMRRLADILASGSSAEPINLGSG